MKRLFEIVGDFGPLCLGLDPNINRMPDKDLYDDQDVPYVYDRFCTNLLKSLRSIIKIVKFQSAYFEAAGPQGLISLRHVISDAKKLGYYTILDAKRSDISTTAEAYAKAAFDIYDADALTILPFMGEKSIRTFVDYARKKDRQIFVVVYPTETSVYSGGAVNALDLIQRIGDENLNNGYGDIGAVVSGIMPNYVDVHRRVAPRVFFLIPGMGVQGGKIEDQSAAFNEGNGAILNYSRSLIYAEDPLMTAKYILNEINIKVKI
ncbi:MAG: orotidine-5'-phosphate decarboxylase [Nitrososphaeraceae archaeon]